MNIDTKQIEKICYSMLKKRGYTNIETDENDKIIGEHKDGDNICIFLNMIDKLKIKMLNEYMTNANDLNIKHFIIIYTNCVTSCTMKVIQKSKDIGLTIETFYYKSLLYDVTEHRLVPKHEKLSLDEAKEITTKFGTKIPVIKNCDVIARFYNYSHGDIIKITRPDNIAYKRVV